MRAERWHEGASAFAEAAVRAGSPFATFFVGSVDFYTSNGADETSKARRKRGTSLHAAAAVAGSKEAHHTLAIMHFNGSGGRRKDKDPESGAELCARGNILFGSVAAKRELGHCLQDGFGVEQDVALGRKLLAEAAKEDADGAAMDAAVMAATAAAAVVEERLRKRNDINTLHAAIAAAAEVSAAAKAAAEAHLTATPENRFLLDWYGSAGHQLPRASRRARTRCAAAWRRGDTSFADARAAAACGTARGRANPPTGDCSTNSRACLCSSCTAGSSPTSNRKIQARGGIELGRDGCRPRRRRRRVRRRRRRGVIAR